MTEDTLGARIGALIAATGLSRRAWGAQHGWGTGQLYEIIAGKRVPQVHTLRQLARDLGVGLDELLDGLEVGS